MNRFHEGSIAAGRMPRTARECQCLADFEFGMAALPGIEPPKSLLWSAHLSAFVSTRARCDALHIPTEKEFHAYRPAAGTTDSYEARPGKI